MIEVYSAFERMERKLDGTPQIGIAKMFGPYSPVAFCAGCKDPVQTPTLISNMAWLEIINRRFPEEVPKEVAEEPVSDDLIRKFRKDIESDTILKGVHFRYNTGRMHLTPLGEQFLDACVRERQI